MVGKCTISNRTISGEVQFLELAVPTWKCYIEEPSSLVAYLRGECALVAGMALFHSRRRLSCAQAIRRHVKQRLSVEDPVVVFSVLLFDREEREEHVSFSVLLGTRRGVSPGGLRPCMPVIRACCG